MNGYLNNLTMRTLNTGNRVEPRLPALFEPSAFQSGPAAERIAPFEEELTTVSEPAPRGVKTEGRVSGEASSHGPHVAQLERHDSPAVTDHNRGSSALNSDEDFEARFAPVFHHEEEPEDPVETLTVQATLQPRTETVEIPTPVNASAVETAPISEELEERLTPSLEIDDSALLTPISKRESQNLMSPRIPRRNPQARPAALIPAAAPETDQFQTQITFRRTTPPDTPEPVVAPVEVAPNEEVAQAERQVTNKPEAQPELESTTQSTYRRVNPTPANWRDTRQQQWRRRQSPAPVEPEPSINVTIGRIEVRAVPADNRKSTSSRRSESPVMPLEDYLRKQRRGGER